MSEPTARDFIRAIPKHLRTCSTSRSLSYFFLDVGLFLICGAVIVHSPSLWLTIPTSILMGMVLTGIFVVGHDCGHRSFSPDIKLNDAVGEFATGLALWPYASWRLSHDIHHRHTHNIAKDIAWIPTTLDRFQRLSMVHRTIYYGSRTFLFFLASVFFTFLVIRDGLRGSRSRHFRSHELPAVKNSIGITVLLALAYVAISLWVGGWGGLLWLFVIPQLVFQAHLSTFTLFHHTHPDNRFYADDEWTFEKGQFGNTWHIAYPWLVEKLCHDINWHVPHHVCVGVPHYHLREAHGVLKQKFPELVREEVFSLQLVRDVVSQCHFITDKTSDGLDWTRYQHIGSEATAPDPLT